MKIFRIYWSRKRQKYVTDQVLSVTKETKTMLIAIDRRNPNYNYRFRKPDVLRPGTWVTPVGKRAKPLGYHYELYLESGAI